MPLPAKKDVRPSVDKLVNPIRRDTSCIDDDSHVENTSGTKISI